MFRRLTSRLPRGVSMALGLLAAFAVGVAAAFLFQALISTSIEITSPQMQVGLYYSDDDGVENATTYDLGDVGDSDPAGVTVPGSPASRITPDIQSCTITNPSGSSFDVSLAQSYADAYCSFRIGFANQGSVDMTLGTITTDLDPAVVTLTQHTPAGQVWPADGSSSYVEMTLHVDPGAADAVLNGTITVPFEAQ